MERRYSELIQLSSFEDRFRYLRLGAGVGEDTFGYDRYMNQQFYQSVEWRRIRDMVIARDYGMDLGVDDHPIKGRIIIHHMNPIAKGDIIDATDYLLDPEYLICVSHETHNALHYGTTPVPQQKDYSARLPNDTCLWR